MSESNAPEIGSIAWRDLTVPNADEVQGFYAQVVGWKTSPVSMGEYDDYNMESPQSGKAIAGVCHARGVNAKLPPQWLIYVVVENVEQSVKRCVELGGAVIDGPRNMGDKPFCVIRDPAGAHMGLVQK